MCVWESSVFFIFTCIYQSKIPCAIDLNENSWVCNAIECKTVNKIFRWDSSKCEFSQFNWYFSFMIDSVITWCVAGVTSVINFCFFFSHFHFSLYSFNNFSIFLNLEFCTVSIIIEMCSIHAHSHIKCNIR